jgi:hypothetical protein
MITPQFGYNQLWFFEIIEGYSGLEVRFSGISPVLRKVIGEVMVVSNRFCEQTAGVQCCFS